MRLFMKKDTKFAIAYSKETKIKQVIIKYIMENLRVKRLTEGKFTVLHVVPDHHCDMRTSPVTPPTGAP